MAPIKIIIPGQPLPWKAPYVGTRGAFSPRYHESQIIKKLIREQYCGDLLDGPLCCDCLFYLQIPKSTSKKRRALMLSGHIRPEGTPDRTNLAKLIEDLLQGIVIVNDKKIVDGRVAKFYSEIPETIILVERI